MTPPTSKGNMPKVYEPKTVERRIYDFWFRLGHFTPSIDHSKQPFVVIMPPPNVTGELHVGHALTISLEDLMVRWHRMKGDPTLYLPGTDHAGIATQWVVERMLMGENLTRHQLGREEFLKRVWEWVEQYGGTILEQMKRLGASCDWTRKSFTLDEGPSTAVRTTFVNLYKKGLIYRGERIINWCPRCATALSDLEVKHREENGSLYYIRYPIEDGTGSVTVATTRPETLLGDAAIAVHPQDQRYTHLVGKKITLPIVGRVIEIVSDDAVDPEFGTGALKVTPGHDPSDFEIGQRHSLPIVTVMHPNGTMNKNAGIYEGQDRFECRNKVTLALEHSDLLEKVEPHDLSVGHCDRCDEVVEPTVSKQWFVKMEPLSKPAKQAVINGQIKIIPERFSKVYFNWMDNIRDWCISRQLWWGHRIPVWYCQSCDEVMVENEDPITCSTCDSTNLERDPDVLDTWFSSALWTHSTLGWPKQTEELEYFYPTSVMETGHDILFFWVARMLMMGMENMDDIPFRVVYLHGLVVDPEGIRMSKTRGNVLDPLQLIDIYGADALRFALTTGNSPGNNMRLNEQKLEASRNFANKLWNAARFVMSNLEGTQGIDHWPQSKEPIHRQDRWILSRFNRMTGHVGRFMEEYQFGEAQRIIHDFLWGEYCDWYIEMAKIRLTENSLSEESQNSCNASPLPTLTYILESVLRLLHPFMPFITEEIWQALTVYLPQERTKPGALIVASYPTPDTTFIEDEVETEINVIIEIVRSIRNLRAEFHIQPSRSLKAFVDSPQLEAVVRAESETIKTLARVEPLKVGSSCESVDDSHDNVSIILTSGTVTIPLKGLVDLEKERARLKNELNELCRYGDQVAGRLQDKKFLTNAPEDVVERERKRLNIIEERRTRITQILCKPEK